ncbi:TetR family transcriptional regulator [Embleya sp. NPDC020886]|uniref:TetR family transcriptional regulator n=1 Tax=Embleya sp. NPDC020886 TaxID=3363980 RepID=UPI0037B48A75
MAPDVGSGAAAGGPGGGRRCSADRDIAACAGTTPATVYRYVGSKDRLLHDVVIEWAE